MQRNPPSGKKPFCLRWLGSSAVSTRYKRVFAARHCHLRRAFEGAHTEETFDARRGRLRRTQGRSPGDHYPGNADAADPEEGIPRKIGGAELHQQRASAQTPYLLHKPQVGPPSYTSSTAGQSGSPACVTPPDTAQPKERVLCAMLLLFRLLAIHQHLPPPPTGQRRRRQIQLQHRGVVALAHQLTVFPQDKGPFRRCRCSLCLISSVTCRIQLGETLRNRPDPHPARQYQKNRRRNASMFLIMPKRICRSSMAGVGYKAVVRQVGSLRPGCAAGRFDHLYPQARPGPWVQDAVAFGRESAFLQPGRAGRNLPPCRIDAGVAVSIPDKVYPSLLS